MLPPYGSGVTRRTFLAGMGAAAVGASGGAVTLPGVADAHGHHGDPHASAAKFAVVTDTHVNLAVPDRTANLARVMRHIAARDPDFVLHCGDIGDYGVEDEFALYRSTIPDALASRLHHVPGNHETQWNADAWEAYHDRFGPAHHSFDAAGLHVLAMDPLVSQQWPAWQFSEGLLEFIDDDLSRVPRGTPIVLFNHFPLSEDWFYVNNYERLLELIQPYQVRVAFAGHTHHRQIRRFNGLTQVVGNAIINGPVYYWAERTVDVDRDRLVITEVVVPATGDVTETVVADAPLTGSGPGGTFGPLRATAAIEAQTIRVSVRAPDDSGIAQLTARPYPQGVAETDWAPLTLTGTRWTGVLDASTLAPGPHRLQVQASDGQDPVWDAVTSVTVPTTTTRVAWTHRLPAQTVMADLAQHDGLVVAATTGGVVEAFEARPAGARTRWRRNVGGVYKGPVFTPAGETVLVGSTDHHLYALRTTSGRTSWRRDLGAPVQCGIAVVTVGGDHRVLVAAGSTLFCLGLDGAVVWRSDLGGTFTGLACTDGQRVYAGSEDGNTYAFEAATGARVWASLTAEHSDTAYDRISYGPWGAQLGILPTGDVLVPMHETVSALDAASGVVRWTVAGLARVEFTRPTITDYGALVFDGKDGTALLLDPVTGARLWTDDTLPFVPGSGASFGSAPVATSDPAVYWMVATSGLLTRIDLGNRKVTAELQVSAAFTTSTAVLVASRDGTSVLVTVNHDGEVNGVAGLEGAR